MVASGSFHSLSIRFRTLDAGNAHRWLWLRSLAVVLVCVAGLFILLPAPDRFSALTGWLAWPLARVWLWQVVLAVGLLSVGQAILIRALGVRHRSALFMLAFAGPVGAVAFAMGLFIGGFLGLFRPAFAVAWVACATSVSLWSLRNHLNEAFVELFRRAWPTRPTGPLGLVPILLGLLAVAILYLQILSPESITYDASWTHLTIAQDYARQGRIVPFLADWPKNLPHLGSVLNTWSYLVPGLGSPALKAMMALHTEFVFLLWTLVAVAAGIEALGARAPGAWAAFFLFPAIYLEDHFLGGGADHFLAFFSVPILLATLEAVRTLHWRWWVLLAIVSAGAVLTKLQAIIVVLPAALALALALLADLWRRSMRRQRIPWARVCKGPGLALAISLLLTAPYFVPNLLVHHNPIYPIGQRFFAGSRPTMPDAPLFADFVLKSWGAHPPKSFLPWLRGLEEAITTFPCHPLVPEGGAMVALALLLAPFLPRARRVWFALAFSIACLATWNFTYVQGRNLEGMVPIVAVAVGATLVRGFRLGGMARLGVGLALIVQIAASLDVPFLEWDRCQQSIDLIRSNRLGRDATRFDSYQRDYVAIGDALPRNAVVLMHDDHPNLGIDRTILNDWLGFQGLIDHRTFTNARDLYLRYKALGVTHVVYQPGIHPAETRQSEAVFSVFAYRNRSYWMNFGRMRMFPMPAEAPPEEPPYQVLLEGIHDQIDGLYQVTDLGTSEDLPRELQRRRGPILPLTSSTRTSALNRAEVLLLRRDSEIAQSEHAVLWRDFSQLVAYPELFVYVRQH
jgi:hypothetical protein